MFTALKLRWKSCKIRGETHCFSSTAATYGEPKAMPITEETPTNPKIRMGKVN